MNDQNELIIIKKVVEGDVSAFSELVDRYKDLAITLAFNVVLNREDAEDIVQDSFVKAYLSLRSFKGNSKFSTWFYRIVLNTSLNKRKLKKLNTVSVEDVSPGITENNIQNVLSRFSNKDQRKYIEQALNTLSEGERVCITMYYLNELSVDEINELTGFTTSNIKVLLYRARKHLYNELHRLLKDEIKDLI
ncbi:MAG: sigma-70 family polymerase sigma factor [Segetibacter sp.]|nr:sigma-70 family polymerase sigma factor [Segetibacter sp.]